MPGTAPPRPAAPPAPTVASTILMPQDRIARRPLVPWAESLVGRLVEARRGIRRTQEYAGELSAVGNNAGLIAASRGDMAEARRLTERQLWWHGRQARRSGDSSLAAHGVQPWVNLGRLESLTGRLPDALARFSGLQNFALADRLELGCVRVEGRAWTALVRSREQFLRFLEVVYVSDSLRAMLLNRRLELVLPFVARCGEMEGTTRWVGEEARVVAECGLGDPAGAAARARDAGRETRGWFRAVFHLRRAEALACAGEAEEAAGILGKLAALVEGLSDALMADPQLMAVTARLAGACREAGPPGTGYAVARRVLQGARAAGDELVEIEMLQLLAATAPGEEAEGWAQAARAAMEATDYARYRRGTPSRHPVIAELYGRLEQAYAS
jgi:hypothetical protein